MFMEQVNNQKRKTGNLSFNDVNALALKILKEQKEIRNQEKSSFKKIMIDEFQDNNGRNRNMLYLLAEKDDRFTEPCDDEDFLKNLVLNLSDNKLYFVGDEKQSIYRFQVQMFLFLILLQRFIFDSFAEYGNKTIYDK